jgi:hypothetical protein
MLLPCRCEICPANTVWKLWQWFCCVGLLFDLPILLGGYANVLSYSPKLFNRMFALVRAMLLYVPVYMERTSKFIYDSCKLGYDMDILVQIGTLGL